jgi:hypothetical protein
MPSFLKENRFKLFIRNGDLNVLQFMIDAIPTQ